MHENHEVFSTMFDDRVPGKKMKMDDCWLSNFKSFIKSMQLSRTIVQYVLVNYGLK